MKIILTKNVPSLGQACEVKEVSSGYARNFLLPQKLAHAATPASVKAAKIQVAAQKGKAAAAQKELTALTPKIAGQKITLKAKADPAGKLYGAIKAATISAAIAKKYQVTVPPDRIIMPEPIKLAGQYEIALSIGGKEVNINIEVIADKKK